MTSFDTTLNAFGLNLAVPNEDEVDPHNPVVVVIVPVGTLIPGPGGQVLPIPTGTYRIPLPRDMAIDFGNKLAEEAEKLPEAVAKPDILVPGTLDDTQLQQAAQAEQAFRGPQA